jgi:Fe-S-cluster-containing hydrogenase component 2
MKRKIIKIEKELCSSCGLCVEACHEGAIQMVDGKAQLVSDQYCDGLGDCLPACPAGAIEIIEREADPYDQKTVDEKRKSEQKQKQEIPVCACAGAMSRNIAREKAVLKPLQDTKVINNNLRGIQQQPSELQNWPIQLKLINPGVDYLNNANILVMADCVAYAYGNAHQEFIKDRMTIIGCPKLDDNEYYTEKLTEIFQRNNIKSITAVRMEVPCCGGLFSAVKTATLKSETIVPYKEVVIGINGEIKQ